MHRIRTFLCLPLILLSLGCSSIFYYPEKKELVYRHKMPIQPEDIYFKTEDGVKLHGWYFKALELKEPKAVVVQFHGNGENLTTHFLSLYEAPARGVAYMIFDYRGYGESEGKTTPAGTVKDGIAAIRWMHAKYPKKPLIIFAQSLGGAVAFRSVNKIKNEIPISLMLADSTFPDYRSAARTMFAHSVLTFLFQPLAWVMVDNSESPKKDIPELSPIPLIVVHGTKDRTLNQSLGKEVFALAKEPKEFWSIPDGQHIDFMFREDGKYLDKFFERVDAIVRDFKPASKVKNPLAEFATY